MAISLASVNEEVDGEDRFAVCGEESWGHEGLFITVESWLRKFLSSVTMVRLYFPAPNLLLKLTSYQGKKLNFNTGVQGIQDTYILEAGLVEVVVGSEKRNRLGFGRGNYYLKAKYVP